MILRLIATVILIILFGCSDNNPIEISFHPVPIKNTSDRVWEQGWISVPENRIENSSNLIELPFIFSHTTNSDDKDHVPILIMSGGPGNSSLHMANGVVNTIWGKKRDVLVFEQRGTIYAKPSLTCPEIDSFRIHGIRNGFIGRPLDSLKMLGVQRCYERLIAQDVDLNGYNSLESVEDLEALRKVLKIDKLILYGMSYSCNLMAAYAQKYPHQTQALILDSPLPHQTNYDEETYQNIDSILAKLIEHYSDSDQLFFDWKRYINSIRDSIFEVSINNQKYSYSKNELIDVVLFKMSSHNTLSEIASTIKDIIIGDHESVVEVINHYLNPSGQALGMRFSLWIGEELSQEKEVNIRMQEKKYPWLAGYPPNDVSFETAKTWKVNSIYNQLDWPEDNYDGPALILSGQFDPWTPPWYGSKMKNVLPNARHLIYPEHSHLPGFTQQGFKDIDDFLTEIRETRFSLY